MITPTILKAEQMLADAQTKGERIEIATSLLAVSLGGLCALIGREATTEIAYRHADALATMRPLNGSAK
jgi:hypothetical protein